MNEKERKLMERLLAERIEMILEDGNVGQLDIDEEITRAEQIITDLPEAERVCLEAYVDHLLKTAADHGELLYKAGIVDGICLMNWLFSLK